MLKLENLNAWYDRSHVIQGVALEVKAGEIVTLMGRNGAGKTTTLRSIMGLVAKRQGSVLFDGRQILPDPAHTRFHLGLAYVPEERRIVPGLSVRENLRLGIQARDPGRFEFWRDATRLERVERELVGAGYRNPFRVMQSNGGALNVENSHRNNRDCFGDTCCGSANCSCNVRAMTIIINFADIGVFAESIHYGRIDLMNLCVIDTWRYAIFGICIVRTKCTVIAGKSRTTRIRYA